MLAMPEFSTELSQEELKGLQKLVANTFNLNETPHLAIINDVKNKFGEFLDVVAYTNIPYFIRLDRKTGKFVRKTKQENHVPISENLSEGEKGDLYGYLMENQNFADRALEDLKQTKIDNYFLYQVLLDSMHSQN